MTTKIHDLESHLEDQAEKADQFLDFFWHVIRSAFILRTLEEYHRTKSVVDIGAGAGVFFKHYLTKWPESKYFFIEPIQSLRDRILKFPGSQVITDTKAPLNQEAVVLLDVLEHIETDQQFLKDLFRRMPADSLLIITCPALNILWSTWDIKMGHYRRYTRKSLIAVVEAAGFEVQEARYLFHLFLLPALWRKWQPSAGAEFPQLSNGINGILKAWAYFELRFLSFLPFGTSITVVAKKIK